MAFYSIPMEIYEYTSYIPDGKGSYTKVTSTVSIPHEASIGLIDLSDYENIAEDYSVLPSISGSVLTHTIGDPSSYQMCIRDRRRTISPVFPCSICRFVRMFCCAASTAEASVSFRAATMCCMKAIRLSSFPPSRA